MNPRVHLGYWKVGTARCAVRAAFSGATYGVMRVVGMIIASGVSCSARWHAGGDTAARRPYQFKN